MRVRVSPGRSSTAGSVGAGRARAAVAAYRYSPAPLGGCGRPSASMRPRVEPAAAADRHATLLKPRPPTAHVHRRPTQPAAAARPEPRQHPQLQPQHQPFVGVVQVDPELLPHLLQPVAAVFGCTASSLAASAMSQPASNQHRPACGRSRYRARRRTPAPAARIPRVNSRCSPRTPASRSSVTRGRTSSHRRHRQRGPEDPQHEIGVRPRPGHLPESRHHLAEPRPHRHPQRLPRPRDDVLRQPPVARPGSPVTARTPPRRPAHTHAARTAPRTAAVRRPAAAAAAWLGVREGLRRPGRRRPPVTGPSTPSPTADVAGVRGVPPAPAAAESPFWCRASSWPPAPAGAAVPPSTPPGRAVSSASAASVPSSTTHSEPRVSPPARTATAQARQVAVPQRGAAAAGRRRRTASGTARCSRRLPVPGGRGCPAAGPRRPAGRAPWSRRGSARPRILHGRRPAGRRRDGVGEREQVAEAAPSPPGRPGPDRRGQQQMCHGARRRPRRRTAAPRRTSSASADRPVRAAHHDPGHPGGRAPPAPAVRRPPPAPRPPGAARPAPGPERGVGVVEQHLGDRGGESGGRGVQAYGRVRRRRPGCPRGCRRPCGASPDAWRSSRCRQQRPTDDFVRPAQEMPRAARETRGHDTSSARWTPERSRPPPPTPPGSASAPWTMWPVPGGGRLPRRCVADCRAPLPPYPGRGAAQPGPRGRRGARRVRTGRGERLAGAAVAVFGPPRRRSAYSLVRGRRLEPRARLRAQAGAAGLGAGPRRPHHALDLRPAGRRNARFNLAKLGAVGTEYLVDFYGPMSGRRERRRRERPADGDLGPGGAGHSRTTRREREAAPATPPGPDGASPRPPRPRRPARLVPGPGRTSSSCAPPTPPSRCAGGGPCARCSRRPSAQGFRATGMSRDGWYTLTRETPPRKAPYEARTRRDRPCRDPARHPLPHLLRHDDDARTPSCCTSSRTSAEGWSEFAADPEPLYCSEFVAGAETVLRDFLLPTRGRPARRSTAALVGARRGADQGPRMAKAALETAVLDAELRAVRHAARPPTSARCATGCPRACRSASWTRCRELLDAVERLPRRGVRPDQAEDRAGLGHRAGTGGARALRRRLPLQVDANTAYTLARRPPPAPGSTTFDLLLIEQPLDEDDLHGHAQLARAASHADLPGRVHHSAAGTPPPRSRWARAAVVNIKPGRVGGYLEARRIHDVCRARTASRCGAAACWRPGIGRAANLALAALPGFTLPGDTSASDRYFAEDITEPFVLEDGHLAVPDRARASASNRCPTRCGGSPGSGET